MPFLNVEPFIQEAIESVLAQTSASWELLLIDDGSSDGSTATARGFAEKHPDRIRYLEHPGHENRGASASRNLGIARAQGEYLALLDADDVWLPNKLADQVPLLDAHPEVGVVCGSTLWWYSWGGSPVVRRDYVAHVGIPHDTVVPPPELLALSFRAKIQTPCTCSLLLRTAVVREIGGFEERFRYVFTDQALYAKLFLSTPFLVMRTCWDQYRQHQASACATADRTGTIEEAHSAYLDWLREYLAERGWEGSDPWRAMERYRYWSNEHPAVYQMMIRGRTLAKKIRSRIHGSAS